MNVTRAQFSIGGNRRDRGERMDQRYPTLAGIDWERGLVCFLLERRSRNIWPADRPMGSEQRSRLIGKRSATEIEFGGTVFRSNTGKLFPFADLLWPALFSLVLLFRRAFKAPRGSPARAVPRRTAGQRSRPAAARLDRNFPRRDRTQFHYQRGGLQACV